MANYTVKFKHVNDLPSVTTGIQKGEIFFAKNAQMISVWDGTDWENYGGNVLDATYSSNILTISKVGGSNVVLDFSDVASAEGTNRVLAGLRSDINNLQTATGIADEATAPAWAGSHTALASAATLKAGIESVAAAVEEEADRAAAAEGSLDSLQTTAKGSLVAAINEVKASNDDKVASVTKGTDGTYVSISVNNDDATAPVISVSNTVVALEAASESNKGLAEASDVLDNINAAVQTAMDYIDDAIEDATYSGNIAAATSENENKFVSAKQVKDYASGVVGAMHFRGVVTGDDFNTAVASIENPAAGDIVLYGLQEYVYGGSPASWHLFGDEGAYDAAGTAQNFINGLDATESQTAGADGLALEIVEEDGKITSISGSIAAETYDAYGAAAQALADAKEDAEQKVAAEATRINAITGTPDSNKTLQAEIDDVEAAIADLEASGSINKMIDAKINAIALSDTATSNGLTVGVEIDMDATKKLTVSASIAAETYDDFGAAATAKSEVIGVSGDAKTANTIYGAKAYADDAVDTAKTALQADIDALEALVGSVSVASQISTEIQKLDADVANAATNAGNVGSSQIKVQVVEADGVLTSVSVNAPKFDLDGAADTAETNAKDYADTKDSALKDLLIGVNTDEWDAQKTLYALKNYADSIVASGLSWDWAE